MGEAKRRKRTGEADSEREEARQRALRRRLLIGLGVILLVAVVTLLAWPRGPEQTVELPPETAPFPEEVDVFGVQLGEPDAPVVVREFADYQCPGCAAFSQHHARLKSEYIDTGKVRLVFFELPLPQHRNAMPAALAARCAGDQRNYWGMNAKLFDNQARWSAASSPLDHFVDYAKDLGLHEGRFRECVEREQRRDAIEESVVVARQLRIASTPTVIVDNRPLNRLGWEQLSATIEEQLARQP
jgi:protein-disulfide isomerase